MGCPRDSNALYPSSSAPFSSASNFRGENWYYSQQRLLHSDHLATNRTLEELLSVAGPSRWMPSTGAAEEAREAAEVKQPDTSADYMSRQSRLCWPCAE